MERHIAIFGSLFDGHEVLLHACNNKIACMQIIQHAWIGSQALGTLVKHLTDNKCKSGGRVALHDGQMVAGIEIQ